MRYSNKDHVFVVMAYKKSRYLEECIQSLENQKIKSRIIISTATPNEYISAVAEKHGLPVFVNHGPNGIAEDWNFAYLQGKKDYRLVTLAHQDDLYDPDYLDLILRRINSVPKPLIVFTDYYEIRDGKKVYSSRNMRIKKILLTPLRVGKFQKSKWIRRRVLSMGNPICCPAVTYPADHLPDEMFIPHFKSNVDWETWERLSREAGSFLYIPKPVMGHRIHEESTTSEVIGDGNGRTQEDLEMISKFWPMPIAKTISRIYAGGQKGN